MSWAGEPRVIGRYRIVGMIGAGGMGQVLLGVAPDGRLAAIKQVLSAHVADHGFRQRFTHEVEASRKVSGAFTAACMDADPHAGLPRLASVYVLAPARRRNPSAFRSRLRPARPRVPGRLLSAARRRALVLSP